MPQLPKYASSARQDPSSPCLNALSHLWHSRVCASTLLALPASCNRCRVSGVLMLRDGSRGRTPVPGFERRLCASLRAPQERGTALRCLSPRLPLAGGSRAARRALRRQVLLPGGFLGTHSSVNAGFGGDPLRRRWLGMLGWAP